MKFIQFTLILFVSFTNYAQTKTISLKKGEVLDVLLLNHLPNNQEDMKEYFKVAGTVAKARGYKGLPGFKIQKHTEGNLKPDILVFGKWSSLANRLKFSDEILDKVPDFNERRRNIWSLFNITYYEISKDMSFSIDKEKYYMVTAFWVKKKSRFKKFIKKYEETISKSSGENIVTLTNGNSYFRYYYKPDYFTITEFENEEAFKKFQIETKGISYNGVLQIHQFILE